MAWNIFTARRKSKDKSHKLKKNDHVKLKDSRIKGLKKFSIYSYCLRWETVLKRKNQVVVKNQSVKTTYEFN